MPPLPRAILFDVFGTLVDWRGTVGAALATIGARHGVQTDWLGLTDAWRGQYRPSMDAVRTGERPFVNLDHLHRESILTLLPAFGAGALAADVDELVRIWYRLAPWPDSAAGLVRLRARFITAPLSNGHAALQIALARHAGFTWDMLLVADVTRHYKPDAQTYLGACEFLGLEPAEVMLAASHNEDLAAARGFGLATAFISRPMEYGSPDSRAHPSADWTYTANSVEDLALQLSC